MKINLALDSISTKECNPFNLYVVHGQYFHVTGVIRNDFGRTSKPTNTDGITYITVSSVENVALVVPPNGTGEVF